MPNPNDPPRRYDTAYSNRGRLLAIWLVVFLVAALCLCAYLAD